MATINYLTTIEFDFGAVAKLGESVRALGVRRPLLVTDPGFANGVYWHACSRRSASYGRLSSTARRRIRDEGAVEAAVALYTADGCDGVVAVGGGSPIDLAKGVALLATHRGPLEQYALILGGLREDHRRRGAGDRGPDDRGHRQRGRARAR